MTSTPAPCTVCGVAADPATGLCRCAPARPGAASGSPHLLAKAESLFESYLAARVVHARRRARDTRVAFLRDPRNREKGEALRHAEREATLLEMQLLEQTRKAQHARNAAQSALRSAPHDPESEPSPSAQASATRVAGGVRECPRCAARIPGSTAACRCGYSFATEQGGAEPMLLSEEELLALRGGRGT
jgi:hypothetical protein